MINGGFIGKIICKWAMFHGYVRLPEGIVCLLDSWNPILSPSLSDLVVQNIIPYYTYQNMW